VGMIIGRSGAEVLQAMLPWIADMGARGPCSKCANLGGVLSVSVSCVKCHSNGLQAVMLHAAFWAFVVKYTFFSLIELNLFTHVVCIAACSLAYAMHAKLK